MKASRTSVALAFHEDHRFDYLKNLFSLKDSWRLAAAVVEMLLSKTQ